VPGFVDRQVAFAFVSTRGPSSRERLQSTITPSPIITATVETESGACQSTKDNEAADRDSALENDVVIDGEDNEEV